MAKLVLLSEGLTGRTHELKAEKTTVGRVDDNAFHLAEPSVSSHHCEILLRGSEVVVKDLNSTNGTFINGEKVAESPLKHGQTLRLGNVEMRLEVEGAPPLPPAAPPAAAAAPAGKKQLDQTRVIPQGVKLGDLEQGTGGKPVFEKNSPFAKKSNKTTVIFITIGAVLAVVIVVLLFVAMNSLKQ